MTMKILVQLICVFLFVFSFENAFSQKRGNVEWICSAELFKLEKRTRRPTMQDGYRLQIFMGNLENAKKFRSDFIIKHPGSQIYLTQNIPDYVLRYGNFLTRKEAQDALKEIRREIPTAIIVDDLVEPPRIELND